MEIAKSSKPSDQPRTFIQGRRILLFFLFLFSINSSAQTFPVQISTQLIPPFSGYISDYGAPGNQNFRILLLFTDFSRPTYDVKLKIKIEGQGILIQSSSWYFSGPFTLEPGVPSMLSGSDLSDLLNENHLDCSGITRQQYDQTKVLPEGFYTITVTAFDFANPIPILVSNEGSSQAWMVLNDPPYLNLPFCGTSVPPTPPQQISFSWTAMNLAAPSSALGSEYIFELWEIFPANQSPGNIVASTQPLYSYTTSQTFLNYGILEPPLTVGREYVWRVHAHDLENRELFRNNGYSELCTFSYGTNLDLLGNLAQIHLNAQALTSRQARCWWDSLEIYSQYRIQFRKVNTPNWFPFLTDHAALRIPDLEANTNYEAEVIGILPNGQEGPLSNIATWHTPAKPIFNCGESSPPPSQQNFHPLTQANTGMIWEIGQFEMQVTSLNGNANPAGWYSGLGKVVMPLGWTIACSFNGIQVGEDHVVYSGEVVGITDGINVWMTQYNNSGNVAPEIETNSQIDSPDDIIVNELEGEIIIDGNTYSYDPQEGTAIEDQDGSLWIVTTDGNVIYGGETGHVFNPIPPTTINTTYGTADFSKASVQLYGFDAFQVQAWRGHYDDVTDLKDNSQVPVSWKSVQAKKYDVVKVLLSPLQGISIDSIFFYTPAGTIYAAHGSGNEKTIYLVGGQNKDRQDLYAGFYSSNHTIINIGKINIVSFEKVEKKIWLVPLSSSLATAPIISQGISTQLKQTLDSIYAGGVIEWNVEVASKNLIPTNWDKNHDSKLDAHSAGLSRYSDEMSSVNSALKYESYYSPNDYFILISTIVSDSTWAELQGEMPRGKNIGYVFTDPNDPKFKRIVAHEIGHGGFALEHSFDGNAPAPKGTTDNLLDYNNGNTLAQWQWAWMHNPSGWTGLDDDDQGVSVKVDMRELLPFINADSSSFTFYSPAGLPITLPKDNLSNVVFSYGDEYNGASCGNNYNYSENPVGSLHSFTLNEKKYICFSSCSSNQFQGYRIGTTNYSDTISHSINPGAGIIGYPCVDNGQIVFVVAKQTFPTITNIPSSNYSASGAIQDHIIQPNFLLESNSTTTEIDALIYPPYSTDAENYLLSNLQAASCGSGLSSYVLMYAFQINKYPEVYNCCIKNAEITSQNQNPYVSLIPLPNAYQSIAPSTPLEQMEQQVNELQENTRLKFHFIDEKRKHINDELLSITSPKAMGDSLNGAMENYTCIWNILYAKTRIHAIQILCQSNVNGDWFGAGNNYEDIVNSLLCFSNDPMQQDSLLNSLRENNNELLQLLWSKLDLDGLDNFVNTITGWIASRATNRPSFQSIHDEAYIGNQNSNSNLIPRYFEFYNWATEFNSEDYRFITNNHWVNGSPNIYLETFYDPDEDDNQPGGSLNTTLDAFDWVAIYIGDDIPSLGLKEHQSLVVPMIWAKWLSTRIQTNDVSHSLELIGNVVLFLATDAVGNALFGGLFTSAEVGVSLSAKFVGQDIKAFVLKNATESEIASAELGTDGKWIFSDLKWCQPTDYDAKVIGKIENCQFKNKIEELVSGDLEVLAKGGEVVVREVIPYEAVFNSQYISTLNGFSDNLPAILAEENISMQTYLNMELKAAADLSPSELAIMNRIRDRIPDPSINTLMVKCVHPSDIPKYLSGQYPTVGGFVSTAADVKHLHTAEELFEGIRLDYNNSLYTGNEDFIAEIRFNTLNIDQLEIPIGQNYLTQHNLSYPCTGTGITSGMNGTLGCPEWNLKTYVEMENGAEMWLIDKQGNQTLYAVFNKSLRKFVLVK
ncbi:hypothetical protein BH09BAC5_BH09BAC5_17120 [soil metagenome]